MKTLFILIALMGAGEAWGGEWITSSTTSVGMATRSEISENNNLIPFYNTEINCTDKYPCWTFGEQKSDFGPTIASSGDKPLVEHKEWVPNPFYSPSGPPVTTLECTAAICNWPMMPKPQNMDQVYPIFPPAPPLDDCVIKMCYPEGIYLEMQKPNSTLPSVDSSGEWNRSPPITVGPTPELFVEKAVHEKLDKILKLLEEQKLPECELWFIDQDKVESLDPYFWKLKYSDKTCIARMPTMKRNLK